MNVILIGYRGTGKSEVGALLARRLGMSCIALDAAIVERAGTSIPQIVEQSGWDAFRDLESVLVAEVAMRDGVVVDTGGGVIERPANVPLLRRNGVVFWLRASVPTIVARIAGGTGRPPSPPARPSLKRSRKFSNGERRNTGVPPITRSTPTASRRKRSPTGSSHSGDRIGPTPRLRKRGLGRGKIFPPPPNPY